jgi:hypothetical protein
VSHAEQGLEARAQLFRALGHPARVLILNLVRAKPRHGQELAAILRLQPPTISHHLAQLAGVGLLRSRKDQYYQMYELVPGALDRSLADVVYLDRPTLTAEVAEDAFRQKVLGTFFQRGCLTHLPAQRQKRQVVLERIVQTFEPGRDYPEPEVNEVLREYHEDVVALRRALIEYGLMTRAHGVYRRVVEAGAGTVNALAP